MAGDRLELAAMRSPYPPGALRSGEMPATPLEAFQAWFAHALGAGVLEPNAMTLSTADAAGEPSARTVLCKDVGPRGFVFYTNTRSRKGRDLAENPRAALTFAWLAVARQVVVRGEVEQVSTAEARAYFGSRPHGHRIGSAASEQSEVLGGYGELVERVRALSQRFPPGSDVPMPAAWGGYVVHPVSVEFWAGRESRLHDRLRYRRRDPGRAVSMADPGGWVLERLSP